jgi:hypothetical protein
MLSCRFTTTIDSLLQDHILVFGVVHLLPLTSTRYALSCRCHWPSSTFRFRVHMQVWQCLSSWHMPGSIRGCMLFDAITLHLNWWLCMITYFFYALCIRACLKFWAVCYIYADGSWWSQWIVVGTFRRLYAHFFVMLPWKCSCGDFCPSSLLCSLVWLLWVLFIQVVADGVFLMHMFMVHTPWPLPCVLANLWLRPRCLLVQGQAKMTWSLPLEAAAWRYYWCFSYVSWELANIITSQSSPCFWKCDNNSGCKFCGMVCLKF